MATWKNHIEGLKKKYIGKKVYYKGTIYNIVDVDYNGVIHIDLKSRYNNTTAIYTSYEADKNLVKEV